MWVGRIGIAFTVWLVACVVAFLLGTEPRPGLIALLVAACAVMLWLFLDATDRPARWSFVNTASVRPRGEDLRLSLLKHVIDQHLDGKQVADTLHRYLTTIADQRLVAHHGLSRRTDLERADRLMGPELADFAALTAPFPRLTPDQIGVLVTRIEGL